MNKILTLLLVLLILTGCSGSKKENSEPEKKDLSFEAYIKQGEKFEFTLDPNEAVSYQALRDGIKETDISAANWRSYFDIKEVYREHYEYDDQGKKTDTYSAGWMVMTVLNDEYIYVDNWSRNGLEWEIFVDGQQTMTMTNNGKVGSPIVSNELDINKYSGADAIVAFVDFMDSWDETTNQKYEGYLNNYELISCSGHLKLLDSSLIQFRHLKDDIYYFAAYGSDDDYAVIFVENDSDDIQRENEYNVVIYETDSYGNIERGIESINLPIWQAYIELMKKAEG